MDNTAKRLMLEGIGKEGEIQIACSRSDVGFLLVEHPHCLYYQHRRLELESRRKEVDILVELEKSSVRSSDRELTCGVPGCNYYCYDPDHLESHWASKELVDGHPKYDYKQYAQRERERGHFPCDFCFKSQWTQADLDKHLYNKAGDGIHPGEEDLPEAQGSGSGYHQCPDCPRHFKTRDALEQHQWSTDAAPGRPWS